MNIIEMIKEGLRIALTSRALWLFGFFVGIGTAANNGNRGHVPGTPAGGHFALHASTGVTVLLVLGILVLIAACGFMYFVSEGALIEGVTRVRQGKAATVREGWRDGLANWAVLFRLTVIYFTVSVGGILILFAPALLALRFSGMAPAMMFAVPAVLIAVPWVVTLYMWKAFASRIAVLENRQARDAIQKARLFLHGRLMHGLKLIVASILGRLIVVLAGVIGIAVAAAFAFGILKGLGMAHATVPVILLASVTLLPVVFMLLAISGMTQSSIWTIGYLTQEQK